MRDGIVSHLTDNKLYANCQHGLCKSRSGVTQLLQVMENITNYFDNGTPLDIIYLNFRKAFDAVPHERLLTKLRAYGVDGAILQWTRSFLSHRTQRVRVGDQTSSECAVLSGIPQGSILGPVLFTVFINDLPETLSSTCHIFADDTKIYNNSVNKNLIQDDIFKLQKWSNTWNLYFNVTKCHVMYMGSNNPHNEYVMNLSDSQQKIESCTSEKDLGVTFDPMLTFDIHIHNIVNKANRMLGIIKRTFSYLNKDTFLKLFKSFVRPHLEYANVIWSPYLKRQSIYVENVQRRATKLLRCCKNMSYYERLKHLRLHSLKGRRARGDLIQLFKIYNGIDDIPFHSLFSEVPCSNTRNSEGKIFVKHCKTNLRKNTFSNRVITNWNTLPFSIKNAKSLNDFKVFIDNDPTLSDLFHGFD